MLEALLDSEKKEKILFFLYSHGEGYAREIARAFCFNLNTVQNQLQKLENQGILYSQLKGKMRIFSFNPRYPFKDELEALLKKAIMYISEEEVRKYYWPRIQPRQSGRSYEEHTYQGGISFAFANPWEECQLDRFRPSQIISKKNSSDNPGSREKNE